MGCANSLRAGGRRGNQPGMGRAAIILALVVLPLAGCATTKKSQWNGGALSKFVNAQRSCDEQALQVDAKDKRRAFFIGCMGALGWTPKPDAEIDY